MISRFSPRAAAARRRRTTPYLLRSVPLALLLAIGACHSRLQIVPPDEPIRISVDVVVRTPEPTGDLGVTRAPSDPQARDRLVLRALRHARIEAAGDRAILLRLRQKQDGQTVLSATHEVAAAGEPRLENRLQSLPWNENEFEEATLASGNCYFRYVREFDDRARMEELLGQAVTALSACPVLDRDGRLYGVVSINWDKNQIVDQVTAHRALSEAADVLALLLQTPTST